MSNKNLIYSGFLGLPRKARKEQRMKKFGTTFFQYFQKVDFGKIPLKQERNGMRQIDTLNFFPLLPRIIFQPGGGNNPIESSLKAALCSVSTCDKSFDINMMTPNGMKTKISCPQGDRGIFCDWFLSFVTTLSFQNALPENRPSPSEKDFHCETHTHTQTHRERERERGRECFCVCFSTQVPPTSWVHLLMLRIKAKGHIPWETTNPDHAGNFANERILRPENKKTGLMLGFPLLFQMFPWRHQYILRLQVAIRFVCFLVIFGVCQLCVRNRNFWQKHRVPLPPPKKITNAATSTQKPILFSQTSLARVNWVKPQEFWVHLHLYKHRIAHAFHFPGCLSRCKSVQTCKRHPKYNRHNKMCWLSSRRITHGLR